MFDSTLMMFLVSGSNFLLLVSQLLLGFALAEIHGIDLEKQKATNTCVKIVLLLIPLYLLALGLLLIFYKWFHVWKKEDVSVGFVYDEDHEWDPARRRFVGTWTNHMAEEEPLIEGRSEMGNGPEEAKDPFSEELSMLNKVMRNPPIYAGNMISY